LSGSRKVDVCDPPRDADWQALVNRFGCEHTASSTPAADPRFGVYRCIDAPVIG
jgi:hypothetical protein